MCLLLLETEQTFWPTQHIYNNHFAVHLKLTEHCKSTILQLKKKDVIIGRKVFLKDAIIRGNWANGTWKLCIIFAIACESNYIIIKHIQK